MQPYKSFPSIDGEHYIKGGTGFNTDKTIPKTIEGIKNRIQVLLASKSFGQENIDAELKNLLNFLL